MSTMESCTRSVKQCCWQPQVRIHHLKRNFGRALMNIVTEYCIFLSFQSNPSCFLRTRMDNTTVEGVSPTPPTQVFGYIFTFSIISLLLDVQPVY